ncbi:hypothetical protein FNV43_RR05244 [Rhamnella rubrinervis]|uniref:Glutathione S-transferase n=1 Tax=Rhamnella rubrinervis TaxID=2594499 RepID=A0A8K0HLR3_9ROSA|nr:hypothetical protein FNV43_RR05244 [Rhamnella rubrinervis]
MAEVVLLDLLPSSFGMRIRIALADKGIEYEYREENLLDKTPLLLRMNPVHKMIPVLIHNGKPISESLNILHYIDEVWPSNSPLLPSSPYQRSHARFWADFVDKKAFFFYKHHIYDSGKGVLMSRGEHKEEAKKEMIQSLKLLEGELGDKLYYGGETFDSMDVAFIPYYCWFHSYETLGGFSVEAECPKLLEWVQRCKKFESVSKSLVDPLLAFEYVLQLRKRAGLE